MLSANFIAGTIFVAFIGACVTGLTWISTTLIAVDRNVRPVTHAPIKATKIVPAMKLALNISTFSLPDANVNLDSLPLL